MDLGRDTLRPYLLAANLIDDEGRIVDHAWSAWYGPAYTRRQERIEAGRRGGRKRAANAGQTLSNPGPAQAELEASLSDAEVTPNQTGRQAGPSVPSVPTEPSEPSRAPARDDDAGSNGTTTNGRAKADLASVGAIISAGSFRPKGRAVSVAAASPTGIHVVGPGWIEHSEHPAEWAL